MSEEVADGDTPVRDREHALELLDDVDSLVRFCSVSMGDVDRYNRGSIAFWRVVHWIASMPHPLPLSPRPAVGAQCGILFAFPESLERRLRGEYAGKAEAWFFCPKGHQQYYKVGKSESEKLKEQLNEEIRKRQRAEQKVAMHADDAREARESAEHERRRANGYKGHAAKITKRAKAGVCPCCNRHFTALERHMATKHPQFTPDCPEPLRIIEGGKAA